jgi:hypothetical protein
MSIHDLKITATVNGEPMLATGIPGAHIADALANNAAMDDRVAAQGKSRDEVLSSLKAHLEALDDKATPEAVATIVGSLLWAACRGDDGKGVEDEIRHGGVTLACLLTGDESSGVSLLSMVSPDPTQMTESTAAQGSRLTIVVTLNGERVADGAMDAADVPIAIKSIDDVHVSMGLTPSQAVKEALTHVLGLIDAHRQMKTEDLQGRLLSMVLWLACRDGNDAATLEATVRDGGATLEYRLDEGDGHWVRRQAAVYAPKRH